MIATPSDDIIDQLRAKVRRRSVWRKLLHAGLPAFLLVFVAGLLALQWLATHAAG